jgi:hypothetical protein
MFTYIKELGFFFFLRMAVAVSSSCGGSVIVIVGNVAGELYLSVLFAGRVPKQTILAAESHHEPAH